MLKRVALGLMVWMLVFNLSGMAASVQAGMIGTQQLLENAERDRALDSVRDFLEKDQVRDQLLALGVAPEEVNGRLGALTTSELREIEQRLHDMPAGGNLLAVIGAVFVVLLILELVGVINIFTKV